MTVTSLNEWTTEKWAIEWVINNKQYGAILTDINRVSETEQNFKKVGIFTKTTYYPSVRI